jgi:hypothetical protein
MAIGEGAMEQSPPLRSRNVLRTLPLLLLPLLALLVLRALPAEAVYGMAPPIPPLGGG